MALTHNMERIRKEFLSIDASDVREFNTLGNREAIVFDIRPSIANRRLTMRRLSALVVALLFGIALTPQSQAAPQFGRERGGGGDRICLYKDIQYQGMEQCYSPGDSIATLQSFSGRTSSIRISGRAVVTVWDDTNFRGHTTVFSQSVPDLGQVRLEGKSWSDRISSLQVASENGGGGGFGRPGNSANQERERE